MALLGALKDRVRPFYREGQRACARLFRAYSPAALRAALKSLGIVSGDTLLVHGGFAQASGFRGTPHDVIECLLGLIGADGNLLMMSMPYRGASEDYAAQDPIFDLLKTPSSSGLISELFRRRRDVERSLSPLHPVLAHGPLAQWLVADHDKSAWSCGRGTPFERMASLNCKFLFYDAPYASLTFMHYVEDHFQEHLPVPLYADLPAHIRVRDSHGAERTVRQYFFSANARARRNFSPIEHELVSRNALRKARIGNSRLLCVAANDVLDSARKVVEEGAGFYT